MLAQLSTIVAHAPDRIIQDPYKKEVAEVQALLHLECVACALEFKNRTPFPRSKYKKLRPRGLCAYHEMEKAALDNVALDASNSNR